MFGSKLPFPSGSKDNLWFYYENNNRTFMLDGQGVTAEVVEPDIGATNGVIHVIDRVLGVPQHTIAEKLAVDPMMSSVYSLGNQNHFNHLFNNTNEEFTYVVASNAAWDEINDKFASAYKILFMGAFGYQVRQIWQFFNTVFLSHYSKSQIFVQKFNFDKPNEFFNQNFFDNFLRKSKLNFWTKNEDFEQLKFALFSIRRKLD